MRGVGEDIRVPIHVFGPETHITAVVPMALGLTQIGDTPQFGDVPAAAPKVLPDYTVQHIFLSFSRNVSSESVALINKHLCYQKLKTVTTACGVQ
jgi:ATP citrate lyase citrate-binding